jgi:hypothetical protein
MKTQKNKAGLYHYKTNDRWKWMAGATAATAAGVTASQAGTITVPLIGNFISSSGGNQLNADLTGDGLADVAFAQPRFGAGARIDAYAQVTINLIFNQGRVLTTTTTSRFRAAVGQASNVGPQSATISGTIPITFTDLSINGGATTNGTLMVTSTAGPGIFAQVTLDSFTYNSTAAVPDSGSTLALLAMGAGGVIALRQRRKAA